MTPTDLEKLRRIDALLEHLLNIAEKRTPGEWKFTYKGIHNRGASFPDIIDPGEFAASDAEVSIEDATFIASCAGNAGAGWKATRAAIEFLLLQEELGEEFRFGHLMTDILAAFPNI